MKLLSLNSLSQKTYSKRNEEDMNNIILIGFMGSGKTSVGIKLAERLAFRFADTDQMIEEKCKRTINSIFANEGEAYFRNLETEMVKRLLEEPDHLVISVGGGLPVHPGNAGLLRQLGQVIYLKASKDTIIKRLKGDTTRPLLAGENPEEKIRTLLEYREPFYEAASNLTVITDGRNMDDVIEEIIIRTGVTR
jgi:shikimate kinase